MLSEMVPSGDPKHNIFKPRSKFPLLPYLIKTAAHISKCPTKKCVHYGKTKCDISECVQDIIHIKQFQEHTDIANKCSQYYFYYFTRNEDILNSIVFQIIENQLNLNRLFRKKTLTLQASTPQNGQTHSNNSEWGWGVKGLSCNRS